MQNLNLSERENVMQNAESVKLNKEVELNELFKAVWDGKWLILIVATVFTISSALFAVNLPDIYKSEATLVPSQDSSLKVPGQLGGLAALAGVNLGGIGGGDKSALALEILKSRDFLTRFIEKNDLYIPIMAAKGWDRTKDELIMDDNIYDEEAKKWVRDVPVPLKPKPSSVETYEEFKKIYSVTDDEATGIVRISIEHYSPYLAKKWIDIITESINEEMRHRDLQEAEKSIFYLNEKIAETNISGIKSLLFSLIEDQTKTVMLANVRDEYVFKTIDPPIVAELRTKPSRVIIVILTFLSSTLLAVFFILMKFINRR